MFVKYGHGEFDQYLQLSFNPRAPTGSIKGIFLDSRFYSAILEENSFGMEIFS